MACMASSVLTPRPPGGKNGLWSYVYNENRVPSEEKGESCEGLHFDIPVVESWGKCKNACNAKVEISTTKWGSRASTKISRRRISAQTLRLSMFQRLTRLNTNHTSWPPGGKKFLWSYVYSEIQVPSEEKWESCEGPHFDIPVCESCETCKNACNAKVEISTTKLGSRASTKISRRKNMAQTLRL